MLKSTEQTAAGDRAARLWVGNDIVDLSDAEARGKSADSRFVGRILSQTEAESFARRPTDRHLWSLWSAKEAAYKVLTKAVGMRPSARSLEVSGADGNAGSVVCGDLRLEVEWSHAEDSIHCISWWTAAAEARTPRTALDWAVGQRGWGWGHLPLSPDEEATAGNEHSAAVRQLAKALLRRHVHGGGSLEVLRPTIRKRHGPPTFAVAGKPYPDWDVSLSHHGCFFAAAIGSRAQGGVG